MTDAQQTPDAFPRAITPIHVPPRGQDLAVPFLGPWLVVGEVAYPVDRVEALPQPRGMGMSIPSAPKARAHVSDTATANALLALAAECERDDHLLWIAWPPLRPWPAPRFGYGTISLPVFRDDDITFDVAIAPDLNPHPRHGNPLR